MSLFHSILAQLEEKISKKNESNENIAVIISTVLHTTVTADQITIRDSTLHIKAPTTVKMALMLNRGKLLKALQEANIPVTSIQ